MKGDRAFTKHFLDLQQSDAWRSLSINARRLLDALEIDHMRHAGKRNGFLLAPRRQLEDVGIGARHVSAAIAEVERVGLVACQRGVGRRPNYYTLNWLPLADGSMPVERWRNFVATSEGKSQLMTSEGKHLRYPKGSHKAHSDFPSEVTKAEIKGIRREAPYKKASYQGGCISKEVGSEGEDLGAEHVDACEGQAVSTVPSGMTIAPVVCRWPMGAECDRPAVDGGRFCAAHEMGR